ncbi:MAG: glycine cleavage T C-terminal barrel domain-containing protein [Pseudomonadota bacterium]
MSFKIAIRPNIRQSVFFDATVADGVQSFGVYNHMLIPEHFGDIDAEYQNLLTNVVMWDVAVQRQVQLKGPDAAKLAQYLTPRNLEKARIGQGRYVPLCDHDGWMINDPVLLKISEECYWLSVADSDIHLWAAATGKERGWAVEVDEPDVSPLAIQGPKAMDLAVKLFDESVREMRYFAFKEAELDGMPLILARAGWSKQGGFELYLCDGSRGTELYEKVKEAGAEFGIGPGAPNHLERMEHGLISYGTDMRWQSHRANPFEMGLGALVDLESGHDFVGRKALAQIKQEGPKRLRVGFKIDGMPKPLGRSMPIELGGQEVGCMSEFLFSERVGTTIGVGLVKSELAESTDEFTLKHDTGHHSARITPMPFL